MYGATYDPIYRSNIQGVTKMFTVNSITVSGVS